MKGRSSLAVFIALFQKSPSAVSNRKFVFHAKVALQSSILKVCFENGPSERRLI